MAVLFLCCHIFYDFVYSWEEQDLSDPLSSLNTQFLRGLLTLGQLQQRNTLCTKAMSAEQVYYMYVKLWEFLFFAGFIIRGLQWISALTSCLSHLSSECAIQRKVLSFKSTSQFSCLNHYIKTLSSCLCAGLLQCGNAECPECESVCSSW